MCVCVCVCVCIMLLSLASVQLYIVELKVRTTAAFISLNKETARNTCGDFQSRLEAMVEANGNFFEWIKIMVFQDIFIYFSY